eukprot:TRINITY_DN2035_c0_g1_i2.p2 TRINITY_DN2035_c0_g1~~TRINITY_DN2035_c0_g1_i2.p2  ORF type:complete len:140 (-),score=25.53 TRINITY_DN2035_c0_g1_i2:88-507(-)
MISPCLNSNYPTFELLDPCIVPFVACGDLSGFDSDQTYQIPQSQWKRLEPVQAPIHPPYETACLLRRTNMLSNTPGDHGGAAGSVAAAAAASCSTASSTDGGASASVSTQIASVSGTSASGGVGTDAQVEPTPPPTQKQ